MNNDFNNSQGNVNSNNNELNNMNQNGVNVGNVNETLNSDVVYQQVDVGNSMDNTNMVSNTTVNTNSYINSNESQQPVMNNYSQETNFSNGKKSNASVILIIILLLVVVGGGIFIFLNKDKLFGDKSSGDNNSSSLTASNSNSKQENNGGTNNSNSQQNNNSGSNNSNSSQNNSGGANNSNGGTSDSSIKGKLQNVCNTKLDSDGNYVSDSGDTMCNNNICIYAENESNSEYYSLNCLTGEYQVINMDDISRNIALSVMCATMDENGNLKETLYDDDEEYVSGRCENKTCYLKLKDGTVKSKVCE